MGADRKLLEMSRAVVASDMKEMREKCGLTIGQASKGCKMSPRTLTKLESGRSNPRVLTLLKLYTFYQQNGTLADHPAQGTIHHTDRSKRKK